MTDTTQKNKISFTGTGANTALATDFPFIDAADLVVTKRITATGVETVLTLATHYTVTGGSFAIGEVTPVDGATDFPSTVTWTIKRATPKTQETDYVENDNFGAETHENALDKLTHQLIDRQEEVDRTLKVPATDADPGELPNSVDRASNYLAFNAGGDPIAAAPPTDTTLVSVYAATLLDDANAAEARTTLDAQQTLSAADLARIAQVYPRGYLSGLTVTRSTSTRFSVGIGVCRAGSSSDQDLADIKNTDSVFDKVFDSGGWDPDDLGGGVPTAAGFAAAIDTWHFFMLVKQDGSAYDFGWDTSLVAANLIADAAVVTKLGAACYYRRIRSNVSTATPNFADFTETGDETLLAVPVLDYNDVTADITTAETITLASVPDAISVKALIRVMRDNATQGEGFVIRSSAEADAAPSPTAAPGSMINGGTTDVSSGEVEARTNTSQQIFMRQQTDSATDNYIVTRGWIDRRGRDD